MKKIIAFITALLVTQALPQSLDITDTIYDTVGDKYIITNSGTTSNTDTFNGTGIVGKFKMGTSTYMQVDITGSTNIPIGGDSIMFIRTVNSQGFSDPSTLSIYIRNPKSDKPNSPLSNKPWTMDVRFSFFDDDSFENFITLPLILKSYDIDYAQLLYTDNSSFDNYVLNPITAPIINAPIISGYTGFTTNSSINSTILNPYYVASYGEGEYFDIKLGHDDEALFIFKFEYGAIPEPSTILLSIFGNILFLNRKRC